MRRLLIAIVICGVALAAATGAAATAPAILSGGGTGTFDGVHPGSQFGFGVVFGRVRARAVQLRDGGEVRRSRAALDEG